MILAPFSEVRVRTRNRLLKFVSGQSWTPQETVRAGRRFSLDVDDQTQLMAFLVRDGVAPGICKGRGFFSAVMRRGAVG